MNNMINRKHTRIRTKNVLVSSNIIFLDMSKYEPSQDAIEYCNRKRAEMGLPPEDGMTMKFLKATTDNTKDSNTTNRLMNSL
jgi:hypothetical protein